jgi:uncharacterized protein
MGAFSQYSLPIQGLKIGVHQFSYTLDAAFFTHFEDTPIAESEVEVSLELDKRSDMLVLVFLVSGWVKSACDRCNADIHLPIEGEHHLYVKYSEDDEEESDEVIFIHREAPSFNVAQYLYEFSVLSLPLTNTYDCQNDAQPPCDQSVLNILDQTEETTNETTSTPPTSSVWDVLKDLNN